METPSRSIFNKLKIERNKLCLLLTLCNKIYLKEFFVRKIRVKVFWKGGLGEEPFVHKRFSPRKIINQRFLKIFVKKHFEFLDRIFHKCRIVIKICMNSILNYV